MIRTGILGGPVADRLLRRLGQRVLSNGYCTGAAYGDRSKLETLLGPGLWAAITDKVVVDFGCGDGAAAIEIARHGATGVIGIDIQESALARARQAAAETEVADRCVFTRHTDEPADVVVTLDGFEHFSDPAHVLRVMRRILKADGRILAAFGPPWLHPLGGHLFSVFPWAHLLFTETALLRWRSTFKHDGATCFGEVEGGLNQMTIRRFRAVVAQSPFEFERFEAVPIRRLRALSNPLTREFLTSFVRCTLRPRVAPLER